MTHLVHFYYASQTVAWSWLTTLNHSRWKRVYAVAWSLSHNNRKESRRLFQQKYCKEPQSANHIKFWRLKLLETGSLVQRRSSTALSEENKENVVRHFSENPSTSIRSVASSLNISKSSVGRFLQQDNFHPLNRVIANYYTMVTKIGVFNPVKQRWNWMIMTRSFWES